MQDADDAGRKGTRKTLGKNNLVGLSSGLEEDIQQGTIFEKEMTKNIRNCENNVAVRNVKHAFSKGICPLHVVEVSTGRAETGLAGKWNPAELITAIAGIHGSVLRISTVEDFPDFRENNRAERFGKQHREPITKDFEEEGNTF